MLKSQTIRVFDVVLIGPAMIWAGVDLKDSRPWLAGLMGFFGVATIGFNAWNYWRYSQLEADQQQLPQVSPLLPQPPPGRWV